MSISVSPFSRAEPEVEKLMLSADRRFSAISKLERVRVEEIDGRDEVTITTLQEAIA